MTADEAKTVLQRNKDELRSIAIGIDYFLGSDYTVANRKDFLYKFSPYIGEAGVQELIQMGFCTAPASTKYHGSYTGGLFDHSIAVVSELIKLTLNENIEWIHRYAPIRVGLLHDLCKVDRYRHTKDDQWEYAADVIPGHGMKSALMAHRILSAEADELTKEEELCIIHHMGAYEKDLWKEYDLAIRSYPTVLWTHTADMIASKVRGY